VKGSIDVASVLADGEVRVHDGLLAMANCGVLYIDEINLLADHVVDLILDAAATGVNRVERDALSVVQPARFSLIGTMNPEEGELRPQLLDRFAMIVQVDPLMEVEQRKLALRRRIYADLDTDLDGLDMIDEDPSLGGSIGEARALLAKVSLDPQLDEIALRCVQLGIGSLRADVAVAKAARAHAALHGRDSVGAEDVERVIEMITLHRQRQLPQHTNTPPQPKVEAGSKESEPQVSEGNEVNRDSQGADAAPNNQEEGDAETPGEQPPNFGERLASLTKLVGSVEGQGAETARHHEARRPGAFSLTRTIVARLERAGEGGLEIEDIRYVDIERALKRCVIFVVDVSASVAGREATALVGEAIEQLLGTAYRERAQVAVVSFGGDSAQVSLRPTRSLEVARTRLLGLERAGRTPLSRGLATGRGLALDLRRRGTEPLLVVLTDARPNEADSVDPFVAALDEARRLGDAKLDAVVVDIESNGFRLGFAEQLAEVAGALYVQAQAS
jgi:magnesium chelatase subunit D